MWVIVNSPFGTRAAGHPRQRGARGVRGRPGPPVPLGGVPGLRRLHRAGRRPVGAAQRPHHARHHALDVLGRDRLHDRARRLPLVHRADHRRHRLQLPEDLRGRLHRLLAGPARRRPGRPGAVAADGHRGHGRAPVGALGGQRSESCWRPEAAEAVRRVPRRRPRGLPRAGGRGAGADRLQRRRQDHAGEPDQRAAARRRGPDHLPRTRTSPSRPCTSASAPASRAASSSSTSSTSSARSTTWR